METDAQANVALQAAIDETLSQEDMAAALAAGADPRMRVRQALMARRRIIAGVDFDAPLAAAMRLLAAHDPCASPSQVRGLLLDGITRTSCGGAVVQCVVELGADVHATDDSRSTALHHACRPDAAAALIAAGAPVGAANRSGRTPLHTAAYVEVIDALLAAGADPRAQDYEGRTPLFHVHQLAWQAGATATVQRLLDAGADPTVTCAEGTTAVDEAVLGLQFYADTWVDPRPDNTGEAATYVAIVRLLQRATAWHRRRHLLLAARGRTSMAREESVSAPPAPGSGTDGCAAV